MLVGARSVLLLGIKDECEETFTSKVVANKARNTLDFFYSVSRFFDFYS